MSMIKVGDKLPVVTFKRWEEGAMKEYSTGDVFKGKVVLFGVPGAYTPTCSMKHLPGYVENASKFKDKGVARVLCMAVNDPFVLAAWAKQNNVNNTVEMLPDGNGQLTKALGLEMDGTGYGMGTRCQRFAMVIQDGVVKSLYVEKPGAFEVSGADAILKEI